jgi:hypothetical protein
VFRSSARFFEKYCFPPLNQRTIQGWGTRHSAFYLSGVGRADFFAITAPRTADGALALHDVKDLRIGWSRAAADTTLDSVDSKML